MDKDLGFGCQADGDFGGEKNEGKAATGVGRAADKVEVFEKRGADRGSEEGWNHPVGGPTVKGAAHHGIPGLEIGRREPLLVDDPLGKAGQELFVQDPDDPIGVGGGFFGPVDAFRFRRALTRRK